MDCINFYQPRPNTSTLPAPRADKPGNATFLGLGPYEFVKSPGMGSQLVEEPVFPFLESASELNANSATVMVKMISKLPSPSARRVKRTGRQTVTPEKELLNKDTKRRRVLSSSDDETVNIHAPVDHIDNDTINSYTPTRRQFKQNPGPDHFSYKSSEQDGSKVSAIEFADTSLLGISVVVCERGQKTSAKKQMSHIASLRRMR